MSFYIGKIYIMHLSLRENTELRTHSFANKFYIYTKNILNNMTG